MSQVDEPRAAPRMTRDAYLYRLRAPASRRSFFRFCAVFGALVLLTIALVVIRATEYSPAAAVRDYFSALQERDASALWPIIDPDEAVSGSVRSTYAALLKDPGYTPPSNAGVQSTSAGDNDNQATATASYQIGSTNRDGGVQPPTGQRPLEPGFPPVAHQQFDHPARCRLVLSRRGLCRRRGRDEHRWIRSGQRRVRPLPRPVHDRHRRQSALYRDRHRHGPDGPATTAPADDEAQGPARGRQAGRLFDLGAAQPFSTPTRSGVPIRRSDTRPTPTGLRPPWRGRSTINHSSPWSSAVAAWW